MKLHTLKKAKSYKAKKSRAGRGYGSGGGHTTGSGHKGQKSRTGGNARPGFEGGQNPLYKRLPKYRGISVVSVKSIGINVGELEKVFKSGDIITRAVLVSTGLVQKAEKRIKILGYGELSKKLTVRGLDLSKSASEKILKAGGKVDA